MAFKSVKVYANCDHTQIIWNLYQPIPDCRGFAIYRKTNGGNPEILPTWVGFQDQSAKPGTQQPSTMWPIQKFMWCDYTPKPGQKVQYQIVPMVGSEGKLKPAEALTSSWTDPVLVEAGSGAISAYFNRGVLATQWLSHKLNGNPAQNQVSDAIGSLNNPIREFLAGELLKGLLGVLQGAVNSNQKVYAALFELNDPQLIDLLTQLGERANLVLGNGAQKSGSDENADVRQKLKGQAQLFDRIVTGNHLDHDKFLVLCDSQDNPKAVWTGSTNWTLHGLCSQVNNGLLIEDPLVAEYFLKQWNLLKESGNDYPPALMTSDAAPKVAKIGNSTATVWFAPMNSKQDLSFAQNLIDNAKEGVLFLFFNPGPKGTLLNVIHDLIPNRPELYIHGVVNQDIAGVTELTRSGGPVIGKKGKTAAPQVSFIHRGQQTTVPTNLDIIIPAAIREQFGFWEKEIKQLGFVAVHSKVIIVDPFGDHPVVMTGSHNLGQKASGYNDENLVIIENDPQLAAAYAVNIIAVYNQYRWNYQASTGLSGKGKWSGLVDNDAWQNGYLTNKAKQQELDFWLGNMKNVQTPAAGNGSQKQAVPVASTNGNGHKGASKMGTKAASSHKSRVRGKKKVSARN